MGIVVAKFGGTSLADGVQMAKVRDIIKANPDRKYVVPSAPGKRSKDDVKITDLLYKLQKKIAQNEDYREEYTLIF